jgi:hypothetical protein
MVNNIGLVGAFFPVNGVQEWPKEELPPQVLTAMNAHVQSLPPDQRPAALLQLRAQWHKQQIIRQQQQQQQPSPSLASNLPGRLPGGAAPETVARPPPQISAHTDSNTNPGNVSLEMLQSFMQRPVGGGFSEVGQP